MKKIKKTNVKCMVIKKTIKKKHLTLDAFSDVLMSIGNFATYTDFKCNAVIYSDDKEGNVIVIFVEGDGDYLSICPIIFSSNDYTIEKSFDKKRFRKLSKLKNALVLKYEDGVKLAFLEGKKIC